jgi:hypothetical protein
MRENVVFFCVLPFWKKIRKPENLFCQGLILLR